MSDKEQFEIERALRAQKIVNDPLFDEAFQMVKTAILEKIEAAPLRDTEGAEKLRIMLKLLRDVRAVFEQAVNDGKVAEHRLETKRHWYEKFHVGNRAEY